jgi:hypothetical protein
MTNPVNRNPNLQVDTKLKIDEVKYTSADLLL